MSAPPGVRDRILAAAVELFADHGYDATSVAQIITTAGVAKGGFYHHFASKEDLLGAVYGDLIELQLSGMRAVLSRGDDPATTLRGLVVDLVESTAAHAREAMVSLRELHRLGRHGNDALRRARRDYHDTVAELIRDAQASGEFHSVASAEVITFTIFGMVNELPTWYRPDGPKTAARLATELADLVLAALAPAGR